MRGREINDGREVLAVAGPSVRIDSVGVELLLLRNLIEHPEERRGIGTVAGAPLPIERVAGLVGVDERVPESGRTDMPVYWYRRSLWVWSRRCERVATKYGRRERGNFVGLPAL